MFMVYENRGIDIQIVENRRDAAHVKLRLCYATRPDFASINLKKYI